MVLNFEDIIGNNQEFQFFNTNNFALRLQYHLLRIKTQIAKESIRLKNMEATKDT
jgi:RNA-binding protein YlmH